MQKILKTPKKVVTKIENTQNLASKKAMRIGDKE